MDMIIHRSFTPQLLEDDWGVSRMTTTRSGKCRMFVRTARALQHLPLVPQRQHFELERSPRTHECSEGREEREEHRRHRPEAHPPSAATSTAATRTDFSVETGRIIG
jgi:hypothetical protein